VSNELYRAERCRDLAEEYRCIAAMCASSEMRNHYSQMSEHYSTLADAEELSALSRLRRPGQRIKAVIPSLQ
jgi:hypothetical protein